MLQSQTKNRIQDQNYKVIEVIYKHAAQYYKEKRILMLVKKKPKKNLKQHTIILHCQVLHLNMQRRGS